jgi:hypothetical protein
VLDSLIGAAGSVSRVCAASAVAHQGGVGVQLLCCFWSGCWAPPSIGCVACSIGEAEPPTPGSWVRLTESCVASHRIPPSQVTTKKSCSTAAVPLLTARPLLLLLLLLVCCNSNPALQLSCGYSYQLFVSGSHSPRVERSSMMLVLSQQATASAQVLQLLLPCLVSRRCCCRVARTWFGFLKGFDPYCCM